ncbi:MAG: ABC transporter permease [Bacteroidales bacterium]|nr:ABC transporter permease [Bacteroidales bacterium]
MMQHSFTLMWNQKRKYGFILLELFVIFVVIFMTTIYMIDNVTRYFQGTGRDISQVYFMNISHEGTGEVTALDHFEKVRQRIAQMEHVQDVSLSYQASPYVSGYTIKTFHHGENLSNALLCYADPYFSSVFRTNLRAGKWYTSEDVGKGVEIPVVINHNLAVQLFGEEDPIGKSLKQGDERYVVQGVLEHYKRQDFESEGKSVFVPLYYRRPHQNMAIDLMVRHEEGFFPEPKNYAEAVFSVFSHDQFRITRSTRLQALKQQSNSNTSGDMLFVSLIVGFLLFNLVLGLVGILGYHVNQRISEMGIRRAVGSTRPKVRGLIFMEMLVLTLMATIPALLLVVQIPALELMPMSWRLFIQGMLASLAIIAIFVSISVMYPGIVASKIRPAVALKEE